MKSRNYKQLIFFSLLNGKEQARWYILIEEFCNINLKELHKFLKNYDENKVRALIYLETSCNYFLSNLFN